MEARTFETLYKKSSTGADQEWTVSTEDNVIITRWGQVGGSIQETRDIIAAGKNAGKKNETTPIQQAQLEAEALWTKKLKKGYVKSLDDARAGKVDDVIEGGVNPMLAHKYSEQAKKIVFPALVQPKFDGHRCIAVVENGKATLWTRTRKPITGLPHIVADLEAMVAKAGVKDVILDGELYAHLQAEPGVEVPLTKEQVALVSPEDADEINQHKWSFLEGGYAVRNQREDGRSKTVYMHRQILDAPDGWDVDHKNGNKLDNRRSNLRLCSPSQNAGNQKKRSTNTSGFKGVYYFKRDGTWQAQITVAGDKIHIGYFATPEEAAAAYDAEARKRFGEFALTNAATAINFEELSSFIRTPEPRPGHEVVEYHVYDLVSDAIQQERFVALQKFFSGFRQGSIVPVETRQVANKEELDEAFGEFMEAGYEGLMVRNLAGKYVGKRSYDLQKVKEFDSSEYVVVGVEEGRGKLAGKAIFVCKHGDVEFRCKMKGKLEDLAKYVKNPDLALGRPLEVRYFGITNVGGVPRFPVGLRFRDDLLNVVDRRLGRR